MYTKMYTKLMRLMVAIFFVAGFAMTQAHVVQAATPGGGGPDNPAHQSGTWETIQPGEYRWYVFKMHADTSTGSDHKKHESDRTNHANQVEIRMYTQPNQGADLLLLDAQEARKWQQDGKLEHFGAATQLFVSDNQEIEGRNDSDSNKGKDKDNDDTKDPDDKGNPRDDFDSDDMAGYALWSSEMDASGTYYIVIHRDIHATGPASYQFTVSGNGVTMQ